MHENDFDFEQPKTITEYITIHRDILKDTQVWNKMTVEEQAYFEASATEVQVENRTLRFIRKYL